jgi:uncharacterized membrane protein YraQ (UPF0718 family)
VRYTAPVLLLVASLLALLLGPLSLTASRGRPGVLAAIDGLVFVAIGGLVLIHVLPQAVEVAGLGCLLVAAAALWGPTWIEERVHKAAHSAHLVALAFAVMGLGLHAVMDGAALSTRGGEGGSGLAFAVVLHRFPVAASLWWLLRPAYGPGIAAAVLALEGGGSVLGYFGGGALLAALPEQPIAVFQALVGGSLLHVVLHRPHPLASGDESAWVRGSGAVGALLGVALVIGLGEEGHHAGPAGHGGFGESLLHLAAESAPALLLGYLLAGLVQEFLPKATLAFLGCGGALSQSLRGAAFGLPLPICSCGVVPVYRGLVQRGAPAPAAMSFLVATPELGIDAVLLSIPLLGPGFAAVRVAAAATVAIAAGVFVGRAVQNSAVLDGPVDVDAGSGRIGRALRIGLGEVVDHTAPWIVVGLVIAAAISGVDLSPLASLPSPAQVVLLAAVGLPLYVCAAGATPLVAALMGQGITAGAALALLLTGPATNVTTFGVLASLHGRRAAIRFGAVVAACSIALGLGVDLLLPGLGRRVGGAVHDEVSRLGLITLAVLVGVFIASLLRQGPRGFVAQVLRPPGGSGGGDEDHDHEGHGHAADKAEAAGQPRAHAHPHGHDHHHDHPAHDAPDRRA